MTVLYISADKVGTQSGGGIVTANELHTLMDLAAESGEVCVAVTDIPMPNADPFEQDMLMLSRLKATLKCYSDFPKLAHLYSGCTPETVSFLKEKGCKISYTVAAHDRHISRREHEKLGLSFPYPHLTEAHLWNKYIHGYRLADVIVCPGTVPARTVRGYGDDFARKDIRVIPHGCTLPEKVVPLPKTFTVGYLGSAGPDKGIRYLLAAWKFLAYKDALLVLAGRDSTTPFVYHLLKEFAGGNIELAGWQKNVSDFYNRISLLVQPSATEGFGIEVLEALAHGRPVVCSAGAGAMDVLPMNPFNFYRHSYVVEPCNVDHLVNEIADARHARMEDNDDVPNPGWREIAEQYTWDRVREQYKELWREMLA